MAASAAVAKHYETATCRARALYRIPTAPNSNRTLELHHARASLLSDFAWPGTHTSCLLDIGNSLQPGATPVPPATPGGNRCHANYRDPLPFANSSFDLVVLHRTLDDLANASRQIGQVFDSAAFLERVAQVLVPSGLVAGCVDNLAGLKSLVRRAKQLTRRSKAIPAALHFTLGSIRTLLNAGSFSDVRTFTLLPSCADPLRLIDTDPKVSRIAFRHELQIARQTWSHPGYLARRLAVELGIYPDLEESIFFWAYKRC